MKTFRFRFVLGFVSLAVLASTAFSQSASSDRERKILRFADSADLTSEAKEFYDYMDVWLATPRSASAFKEAYAHALSVKLALRACIAKETNADVQSQMKDLVPKITLVIGRLEEFAGTDLASRKLADISLDVAADAAKRDSLVQTVVASAIASFADFKSKAQIDSTREAFNELCRTWNVYGGPYNSKSQGLEPPPPSSDHRPKEPPTPSSQQTDDGT